VQKSTHSSHLRGNRAAAETGAPSAHGGGNISGGVGPAKSSFDDRMWIKALLHEKQNIRTDGGHNCRNVPLCSTERSNYRHSS